MLIRNVTLEQERRGVALIGDGDVVRMSRWCEQQRLDGIGVARCWLGRDDANRGCAIMCCATERGKVMANTAIGGVMKD